MDDEPLTRRCSFCGRRFSKSIAPRVCLDCFELLAAGRENEIRPTLLRRIEKAVAGVGIRITSALARKMREYRERRHHLGHDED